MAELQNLSRQIAGLQHRLGAISNDRKQADGERARCQTQINKLRNIQAIGNFKTPQGSILPFPFPYPPSNFPFFGDG